MVVTDSSKKGEEVMQAEDHHKNTRLSLLGRQSSIYSLTLYEFQHTLVQSGKHFGSMNMDEFLSTIWAAEGNQPPNYQFLVAQSSTKQLSLSRQVSLSMPGPICQKTVDEVWSEIHKGQHDQQPPPPHQTRTGANSNMGNPGSAQRQSTFGEMTLEEFMIKAGVVREQCTASLPAQHPPYGLYHNTNNPAVAPVMGLGSTPAAGPVSLPIYQGMPQATVGVVADPSGYARNGKTSGGDSVGYSSLVGGGGRCPVQGLGLASPVSPASSDGIGGSQMDGARYGMDVSGIRGGSQRIIVGPVEKVVERRQRRMIKNRESAARSRARKQAYFSPFLSETLCLQI